MKIQQLITEVLKREGWDKFTDHPADRGGPTKWGITQRAWSDYIRQEVTAHDIRLITEDEARGFYFEVYIFTPGFHAIWDENLRSLVVDCAVNHGPYRACRWLQLAAGVKADGKYGPRTDAAVNGSDPVVLSLRIVSRRIKLYGRIVSKDHSQAVFSAGWNNRAAGFLDELADYLTGV